MVPSIELIVFSLDAQLYAIELMAVQRVVRALEVTPLPGAPAVVLGVINVQGELLAVVDLRRRFGLPAREMRITDQFVLVEMKVHSKPQTDGPTRRIALVVDTVVGIHKVSQEEIYQGREIIPNLEHVQGVAKIGGDLLFIHDLGQCLSLYEEKLLNDALVWVS